MCHTHDRTHSITCVNSLSLRSCKRHLSLLTTYQTVSNGVLDRHGQLRTDDTLRKLNFLRLVLDEGKNCTCLVSISLACLSASLTFITAHIVRNPSTRGHKAVLRLRAMRKWCLTGTPLINSAIDM